MSEAIGALTTVLLTFDVLVVELANVGELDRQTPHVGLLGRHAQAGSGPVWHSGGVRPGQLPQIK